MSAGGTVNAGGAASTGAADPADAPAFSFVRGNPTPEEVAAVVTVLLATSGVAEPGPTPESGWSAYRRSVRHPLTPGPQAWRMSARSR